MVVWPREGVRVLAEISRFCSKYAGLGNVRAFGRTVCKWCGCRRVRVLLLWVWVFVRSRGGALG